MHENNVFCGTRTEQRTLGANGDSVCEFENNICCTCSKSERCEFGELEDDIIWLVLNNYAYIIFMVNIVIGLKVNNQKSNRSTGPADSIGFL